MQPGDHTACSLLLVRQSTRLEDGDGFFQVRTSGRQIVAVAAQQTPGAMGAGDLWEHFACLKRLETGRQMFLDFVRNAKDENLATQPDRPAVKSCALHSSVVAAVPAALTQALPV